MCNEHTSFHKYQPFHYNKAEMIFYCRNIGMFFQKIYSDIFFTKHVQYHVLFAMKTTRGTVWNLNIIIIEKAEDFVLINKYCLMELVTQLISENPWEGIISALQSLNSSHYIPTTALLLFNIQYLRSFHCVYLWVILSMYSLSSK